MTEYDYSPDAVERFQAKMAGVGRWANDQRYYAPKYSNPFLPQDQASSSRPGSRTPARQETYPQPAARHHDRPQPTRSRTMPAPVPAAAAAASPPPGHTSRAYAYAAQPDPRPSSASRNRSGSQPPAARYPYPTPVAHQATPAARASPAVYPPPPPGTRQVIMEYKYVPGQAIKLPPPRRGEQYVIVPPKGGRLEVVTDARKGPSSSSSHTRTMSHSHSSGSRSKGSSPTKTGAGDPLFKRLVANLTPKIEWGDGRAGGRGGVRRDSSRRRSASR